MGDAVEGDPSVQRTRERANLCVGPIRILGGRECQQYDAHEKAADEPTTGLGFVLMVQWYAALWVAIDGWRECPLSDDAVDELLTHAAFEHNLQLLRRFRNGVYHYQPVYGEDCLNADS